MDKTEEDAWTWKESSNEEFDRRRKEETFFRIYHLDGQRAVADYKFWGSSPKEALETLNRWKVSGKAVPGTEYFYSTAGYHVDSDGRRFDSLSELLAAYKDRKDFLRKIFSLFETLWYKTLGRIPDAWRWTKDAFRRVFFRHSISESWDLMFHILDDLEYNLPLMIRYMNSYPSGSTFDEWKKTLGDLLLHVKLYRFYDNCGIVDESDPDEVIFGRKWGPTIPRLEGTNCEIEYKRLNEMVQKEWNSIMDILREHGQSLWD